MHYNAPFVCIVGLLCQIQLIYGIKVQLTPHYLSSGFTLDQVFRLEFVSLDDGTIPADLSSVTWSLPKQCSSVNGNLAGEVIEVSCGTIGAYVISAAAG